jgi:hypothetical protein
MIREKTLSSSKPVIDLTGPYGNAFVLMGYASKWSKEFSLDSKAILDDMQSSNYEHLLEVLEEHFGDYVIFER